MSPFDVEVTTLGFPFAAPMQDAATTSAPVMASALRVPRLTITSLLAQRPDLTPLATPQAIAWSPTLASVVLVVVSQWCGQFHHRNLPDHVGLHGHTAPVEQA